MPKKNHFQDLINLTPPLKLHYFYYFWFKQMAQHVNVVVFYILLVNDAPNCIVDKILTKSCGFTARKLMGAGSLSNPLDVAHYDVTIRPDLEGNDVALTFVRDLRSWGNRLCVL